jgi:serine/threonine protein kinase
LIPPTIVFIASDAVGIASQIRFPDGDSCPEFHRWLELKKSGIAIDFRRIQRMSFDVPCLGDYIVNLSTFEERSMICESDEVSKDIYHRIEDTFLVFVKSKPHSEKVEKLKIAPELEKLINLRHPCIAAPIGFIIPIEGGNRQELKIVRMYLEGYSLTEVLSVNPVWFTSTVKAKVVSGLVLGLRFAHSLGLPHGHLTGNNILFDSDHCIQIVDFNPIFFEVEMGESESEERRQLVGFSSREEARQRDIQVFASILFELIFGRPLQDEASIPTLIPVFIQKIIESGLSAISRRSYSFNSVLKHLKKNNFEIENGVDSAEVAEFVRWVESNEYPDN